jgi:hypothetical protein
LLSRPHAAASLGRQLSSHLPLGISRGVVTGYSSDNTEITVNVDGGEVSVPIWAGYPPIGSTVWVVSIGKFTGALGHSPRLNVRGGATGTGISSLPGAGRLLVGPNGEDSGHIIFDGSGVQSRDATLAPWQFNINQLGGAVYVNGKQVAVTDYAIFVPSITNVNKGATGTNNAVYQFSGGPNVGDRGHLEVSGSLVFNGAGAAITGLRPVWTVPAGFQLTSYITAGSGWFVSPGAGVLWPLRAYSLSATTVCFFLDTTGSTYTFANDLSATVPVPVAAGTSLHWHYESAAIRV